MRRRLAVLALTLGAPLTTDLGAQATPADSAAALYARADTLARRQTEGERRQAIPLLLQAAALFRRAGARGEEAEALFRLGGAYLRLGSLDSAAAFLYPALVLRREVGPPGRLGATLGMIGNLHQVRGRADSSLRYYREALDAQHRAGAAERRNEGRTLGNIGVVFSDLGVVDSTLHYYRRARAVLHEAGDAEREGIALGNIGAIYGSLGRADSAAYYYGLALAIARATDDRRGQATTLGNLGATYYGAGRLDSALHYYRSALALQRELGDRQGVAGTLRNVAAVHADAGRLDSAMHYGRQALDTARAVGDRRLEGAALDNLGAFHAMRDEPDSAAGDYARALAVGREVGDRWGEAVTLGHLGELHLSPGWRAGRDAARAAAYLDSAAAAYARIRGAAGGDANAISFAEKNRELFARWTLAWLARRDSAGLTAGARAALAVADRGRAQALLDLLRTAAERAARGAGEGGGGDAARPGADLAAEADALLAPLRRAGTAALSYLVTADTLVAWLALPTGEVQVSRVAVARDTVAALVRAVRADLAPAPRPERPLVAAAGRTRGGGGPPDAEPAVTRLAALLLPPALRSRLPAAGDLVVVPHGALALVPFAALPAGAGGEPLGVRHAVRFAPSLAALGVAESRAARAAASAGGRRALGGALVVGNPTMPAVPGAAPLEALPGAGREAAALARLLGARALTGAAATESAVWARLPRAPLVHLATHGYAYPSEARARESWVALAADSLSDGRLTVGELLDDPALTLRADLVVLSACETGLGSLTETEGTVGLARAFLARGARSVLVSLWAVSDGATELLMGRFYAHWLGDADRPGKAEALRRAQADVRATAGFAHPRHWAAFQLVGAR